MPVTYLICPKHRSLVCKDTLALLDLFKGDQELFKLEEMTRMSHFETLESPPLTEIKR